MTSPHRLQSIVPPPLRAYPELLAVLLAAAIGLTVPAPLRWISQHQGINILLVVHNGPLRNGVLTHRSRTLRDRLGRHVRRARLRDRAHDHRQ